MSTQEFQGRSAAEAAIKACENLGLTRSELKYSVISDTGEGLARRVTIAVEAGAEKARAPRPAPSAPVSDATSAPQGDSDEDNRGNAVDGGRSRRGGRGRSDRRAGGEGDAERAPRRDRGDRGNDRGDRGNDRSDRGNERGRGQDRAAGAAGEGRAESGARRSQQEPREPRGRGRNGDRGRQDGIDSLLTIDPMGAALPRSQAIEPTSERSKRAVGVVQKLQALMGVQADTVLASENEAEIHIHLYGPDEGRIVGKKGEVLLALQFIVNRILSRQEDEGEQVVVLDAGSYRARRQKALEDLAKTLAERSVQERKAVRLSPMSAHDRRIFHMVLKDIDTVATRSEGDGLYRHLLIIPAEFC